MRTPIDRSIITLHTCTCSPAVPHHQCWKCAKDFAKCAVRGVPCQAIDSNSGGRLVYPPVLACLVFTAPSPPPSPSPSVDELTAAEAPRHPLWVTASPFIWGSSFGAPRAPRPGAPSRPGQKSVQDQGNRGVPASRPAQPMK